MEIYQLRTFVVVAREGSITRAAERLHLSQPAVSAHIKAIEDALALSLFGRTARGMSLTHEGQRLLAKAEQTLAVHQELIDEATRIKGHLAGQFRLGEGSNMDRVGDQALDAVRDGGSRLGGGDADTQGGLQEEQRRHDRHALNQKRR